MRLINAKTFEMSEFGDSDLPFFAILSHTWQTDEVSFQDMQDLEQARKKRRFKKIELCCRQAVEDGWDWAWVDTCCIDKTSSVELSEAINSMFLWYRLAMVCYAYISDVQANAGDSGTSWVSGGSEAPRWFRRGWTLQELLAPFTVRFYDRDWNFLGTRRDLAKEISTVTNIGLDILLKKKDIWEETVAMRMSWAADRSTTRIEDRAYSLLGIFNINIPLLYGEGGKAFTRLQHEIMRTIDDDTLFLWRETDRYHVPRNLTGFLTDTPESFAKHELIKAVPCRLFSRAQPTPTNRGLRIELYLCETTVSDLTGQSQQGQWAIEDNLRGSYYMFEHIIAALGVRHLNLFLAALNCLAPSSAFPNSPGQQIPVILLVQTPGRTELEQTSGEVGPGSEFYRIPHVTVGMPRGSILDGWHAKTCYIREPPAEVIRSLSARSPIRFIRFCRVVCLEEDVGYRAKRLGSRHWMLEPEDSDEAVSVTTTKRTPRAEEKLPIMYIVGGSGDENSVDVFVLSSGPVKGPGERPNKLDPGCSLANWPMHPGPVFSHRWRYSGGNVSIEVELTFVRDRGSLKTGDYSFRVACKVRRLADDEVKNGELASSMLFATPQHVEEWTGVGTTKGRFRRKPLVSS
jgi:hypothetical protein